MGSYFFSKNLFFRHKAISSRAFCEIVRSKDYILEFNKIRAGLNDYTFELNAEFLARIEGAALANANVTAQLQLFKASNMYDLKFHLKGSVQCECDVCLEEFTMPIDSDYALLMKMSEAENYDDDEILYITEKLIEYDLSQYLYESLMLSIPARKVCSMSGNKECNKEVITKLDEINRMEQPEGETNPTWDKLKDILKNNN
jgi:uncharacterized metal-binding protein YceD (DUF177 family)